MGTPAMLADTTFLIDFYGERLARRQGPASVCLARHRNDEFRISVVSIAEFSAGFSNPLHARVFLDVFHCLRLFPEAAYEAGAIDRELIASGGRLGEADNLIAGTARYYGIPLVSNDRAFDRVKSLRRVAY
jgi:predicted nucleic acid-binding protein